MKSVPDREAMKEFVNHCLTAVMRDKIDKVVEGSFLPPKKIYVCMDGTKITTLLVSSDLIKLARELYET